MQRRTCAQPCGSLAHLEQLNRDAPAVRPLETGQRLSDDSIRSVEKRKVGQQIRVQISYHVFIFLAVAAILYKSYCCEDTSLLCSNLPLPPDLNMPRTDRDRNSKSLPGIITFAVLGALTGHSRELKSFDSYAIARNANLKRRESINYVPVQEPTTHRRERALTPPPSGRAILQPSQLNEQIQSPMFKLPEELLLLIYEEVLGRNLFHIVRRTTSFQLGHVVCKTNVPRRQEECNENECRGLKVPTGIHAKTGPGDGGLIPLIQSCRKM